LPSVSGWPARLCTGGWARYRDSGIVGLADRSHAPKAHPWRISAELVAVICDLRGSHRRCGPRRLVFELAKRGHPRVSRSTVYRVLMRHGMLEPVPRRRRRDQYRRWERSAAMELWQLDVAASLFLADGDPGLGERFDQPGHCLAGQRSRWQ
jgi:hypothetical protein